MKHVTINSDHTQKRKLSQIQPLSSLAALCDCRQTSRIKGSDKAPLLEYSSHGVPLLLKIEEVCFYIGLSHSTVCELLRDEPSNPRFDPTFPKRIHVKGTSAVRYCSRELREWTNAQVADRDGSKA